MGDWGDARCSMLDIRGETTPGPSLKEGGEPYPAAPLTTKEGRDVEGRDVRSSLPCSRWLQFPAFLQGGDRGGRA